MKVITVCNQFNQISYSVVEESVVKLKDLCRFMTGCERIPYGGFEDKIKVFFKNDCVADCRCYPTVSVCGLTIQLPIHSVSVKEMMHGAIQASPGFGRI